ncbi:MAG: rod shape-determining protein MreC [Betaproteobacteria bacterium]|nr:rod shape-determining protein MreC [Betaproteobacteria bacterium]
MFALWGAGAMNRHGFLRCAAALLFSAGLSAADLQLHAFDSLRGGMSQILSPFRFAGELPLQTATAVGDYFGARAQLLQEKKELEEKLLRQTIRIESLDFHVDQNDELRGLLALKERVPGDWLAADVRQETSQLQQDKIYLNRGVSDGVLPGMTVVDELGVVGQIVRAGAHASAVNLLVHPRQWIAARVRRTGQLAIVRGNGGGMEIYSMPANSDLAPGDKLIADGGVFPAGYPVGKVLSVRRGVRYLTAAVAPKSGFYRRRTLLIYLTRAPEEGQ